MLTEDFTGAELQNILYITIYLVTYSLYHLTFERTNVFQTGMIGMRLEF